MTLISTALWRAFPKGITRYRTVKFGLASGSCLPIDLTAQIRLLIGIYEAEIVGRVASSISPTSCCYDVGAAIGYYTLAFCRLAPMGAVYAFEMDKNSCDTLSRTVTRNRTACTRVQVYNRTLGRHVDKSRGLTTLDDLVFGERLDPPQFVKMDVEGAEYDVLLGGSDVLRNFHPRLIVETHSSVLEMKCIRLLTNLDYRVDVVKRNRLLFENRPIEHNQWICAE